MEYRLNDSDRILHISVNSDVEFLLDTISSLKEYTVRMAEEINQEKMSYPFLVRKILNRENFSLARYQDGEWSCMLEIQPHFSRKLEKNPNLAEDIKKLSRLLLDIIESKPSYYISINAGTLNERSSLVWPLIKNIENLFVGEIFRRESVENNLDLFVESLTERKVLLVGPSWIKNLKMFQFDHLVSEFPGVHKEESVKYLYRGVEKFIEENLYMNPVILYSCGFPGKIMIDQFYKKYREKITQIDTGAIWDPYCGKISRPYHQKIKKI